MNKEIFRAFLTQTRKEAGLTQKELADKLHVTDKAVSKWERALCYPDLTLMEDLAAALGLTLTELMTCQRAPKEAALSEEQSLAVKSALDISGDAMKRQKRKFRAWAGGGVLLLALLAGIFFLFVIPTQSEQVCVSSKQSDGVDHYIYLETSLRHENHLIRLRCPDQETYDSIQVSQLYNVRFRWNRLTWQGTLLDYRVMEGSVAMGGPMDQAGGSEGVDSLFGYDCVWREIVNISYHPQKEDVYLYTYRYYYLGDGSEYFPDGDAAETDLFTVKECLGAAHYDYDGDGIVELFVRTQYEEEPYMLCDWEDGQVASRYVDSVPEEVRGLLQVVPMGTQGAA